MGGTISDYLQLNIQPTYHFMIGTTAYLNIEPIVLSPTKPVPSGWRQQLVAKFEDLREQRWVKKIKWSALGLFLPEAAIAVALLERKMAMLLRHAILREIDCQKSKPHMQSSRDTLDEAEGILTTDEGSGEPYAWEDLCLSYYAVMGGFQVTYQMSPTHLMSRDKSLGCGRGDGSRDWNEFGTKRASTLTPHGVLFLFRRGDLPIVKPEVVKDKSKTDKLAKTLVYFQAGWMILQVVSRAASGLHITLLEIHTVLHVIYAIITYITVGFFGSILNNC